MRVRVSFTFTDEDRLAIASHYGESGKATRKDIELWILGMVTATLEDVHYDYRQQASDSDQDA